MTETQQTETLQPTAADPQEIFKETAGPYTVTVRDEKRYVDRSIYVITTRSDRMTNGGRTATTRDRAQAISYAQRQIKNLQVYEELKQQRRAEDKEKAAAARAAMKPGDILVTCWGYDQTNVEFYEVLRVKGSMATVREVAQERRETGYMSGDCVPVPGRYLERSEELTRRIGPYGLKIKNYITARPWDGTARHWTGYA